MIDHRTLLISRPCIAIFVLAMLIGPADLTYADAPHDANAVNRIVGTVVDHDGHPVAGVQVGAANRKLGYITYSGDGRLFVYGQDKRVLLFFKAQNGSSSVENVTDEQGRFVLSNIMDGPVNVAAAHPQHGVAFINNIDPLKDGSEVKLTLAAPIFASGRVQGVPAQHYSPMPGDAANQYKYARFTPVAPQTPDDIMYNISITIGPDGRFQAGPLPPDIDKWTLAFDRRARNYSATILEIPVTISKLTEHPIDIDLTKGKKLAGAIRGPEDELLPDVSISTVRSDGIRVGGVSDATGNYEIVGLDDGTYTLEAKRWARRTAPG
ncbi:MAG TPA: hypothetical protein PKN33_06825 [Phycisphaerae bacterium]|nr:hypothetical protein [Phycisphaerae bacterium]